MTPLEKLVLILNRYLLSAEAYLELSQTSKIECFCKNL